jgi:purine-nucleoside phosphorylase
LDEFEKISEAADVVSRRLARRPSVGIVLGSGLRTLSTGLEQTESMSYDSVPHWPQPTTEGHSGRLVVGDLQTRVVAVLEGRSHAYEGLDLKTITFGIRVLGALGVEAVILTNAAGAINTAFAAGDLMVIDDHLNLLGRNPLEGSHDARLGARFPDMTNVYSARLGRIADEAATGSGLTLRHGIYAAVRGPSYETPAEIRYLRTIGADAVGMSTVPEAIVARQMGLEVLGISVLTNMAAGVLPRPLSHEEVLRAGANAAPRLASLVAAVVERV